MKFSIVVITYNFENIILECLDSIKKQTFKDFEVIICDDFSQDRTVEICEEWKKKINGIFSVKILSSLVNEGVVKNINKGLKVAEGKWIKVLAGDDILKSNALEKVNSYIEKNLDTKFIAARAELFSVDKGEKKILKVLPEDKKIGIYLKSIDEQLEEMLENNFIIAPTVFMKNELLKEMGYYNERYKMVEDYPMWIKLLKNKVKLDFINEIVVEYRRNSNSVSGRRKEKRVNEVMFEFEKQIYEEIYKVELKNKPLKLWDKYINIKRKEMILKNNNKSSLLTQAMRYLQIKKMKKLLMRILVIAIVIYSILILKKIYL